MEKYYRAFSQLVPSSYQDLLEQLLSEHEVIPASLERVIPLSTLPISVTDSECRLNCKHCNGSYLKSMHPLGRVDTMELGNVGSVLISGGSDCDGKVRIEQHIGKILKIGANIKVNLHAGFQDSSLLKGLKGRGVTISYDLGGDQEAMRSTFGLEITVDEVRRCYLDLKGQFRVVPHITIGLNGGLPSGEEASIEFLRDHQPESLTLNVFKPSPRTVFADRDPPDINYVIDIIRLAHRRLNCPIYLGCMRPVRPYRKALDTFAWLSGTKRIVMPDHDLVKTLEILGIEVKIFNECCSLL